ncbi:MAG: DUF3341 domain-containing protein [Acidobacteriaceae bacterium]|nr:DUF3341 domain-containing protein [Acidobacteriaceae bacterium]
MYLIGDFHDQESTVRAVLDLKANGFNADDLDVFSDEPLEFRRGVLDRRSRMSLAVVTGAIIFCLLAIGFVHFTQYNYQLVTGGMPTFSFWATGVVFYELTLFGAIVTTFFWFLRESGLPRRASRPSAPMREPGTICVQVRSRLDQAEAAHRLLERAGANNVRRIGDAT